MDTADKLMGFIFNVATNSKWDVSLPIFSILSKQQLLKRNPTTVVYYFNLPLALVVISGPTMPFLY